MIGSMGTVMGLLKSYIENLGILANLGFNIATLLYGILSHPANLGIPKPSFIIDMSSCPIGRLLNEGSENCTGCITGVMLGALHCFFPLLPVDF